MGFSDWLGVLDIVVSLATFVVALKIQRQESRKQERKLDEVRREEKDIHKCLEGKGKRKGK